MSKLIFLLLSPKQISSGVGDLDGSYVGEKDGCTVGWLLFPDLLLFFSAFSVLFFGPDAKFFASGRSLCGCDKHFKEKCADEEVLTDFHTRNTN